MKKLNIIICCIISIFISCTNKNSTAEKKEPVSSVTETDVNRESIKQKETPPPPNFTYKKIVNNRYNFSFEIPETWNAKDESDNGDGYIIDAGDINADIRIYGSNISGIDEIDNAGMKCTGVAQYPFDDGVIGTKCSDNGVLYFLYSIQKKRITLYINAPVEFRKKNIDAINHCANSITMKGVS